MSCPACGHQNPSDSRFCFQCGAPVARRCPQCRAVLPADIRFCNQCGARADSTESAAAAQAPAAYTPKHLAEKILSSRIALEGERKQVTVLFADVKGSMDLAEQLDPEEWHGIMDRFFQLLAEGVHRFEGTVNQYTGDGIMALFGAPIAHEDHAQRACWAALHLQEALRAYAEEVKRTCGLAFAVRMGLNSGEVVVGTIGDDLRMNYTAQGHTVGLAQRMEQLADPGTAYLSAHTARLVDGYFRLRDLGEFRVKGVREPLHVHQLEGTGPRRTRLDVSRARGLSRFVGRDAEMAVLDGALARALEGHGQVVGVVAEPGVGKSRLGYELTERCRTSGLPVFEARAVAHGRTIPFLTLLEYLRGYLGIGERDAASTAREKVAGKLLLLDPALTDALPLLFDLLGIADADRPGPRMDPEAAERRLLAVMRHLTEAQSRRGPSVAFIEDLHWIDGGSEAFLANFVEAIAGTRTLLVVTFRPEYHAGWMGKSYYQQLALAPLGPAAAAELLHDLLGADPSLAGLDERIRARTRGNPFFIEEVAQELVETGILEGTRGTYRLVGRVNESAIPATVQAVLSARIDRLPEREKDVLQTAAVIGKDFAEPVLRRVAALGEPDLAAALRTLTQAEFLYETTQYPDAEYTFKHPLTQEVAYRSQLRERRAATHGAVAQALEEVHAAKLDESAALLAYHWETAGEIARAVDWYRRAAQWAGWTNIAAAARHWQKVRELADRLPESPETATVALRARQELLNAAWRLGMPDTEAEALFAEAKALAERAGDWATLALLSNLYAAIEFSHGEVQRCLTEAIESVRLAERVGDPVPIGAFHDNIVAAYAYLGRLGESWDAYTRARTLVGDDPLAFADVYGISPLMSVMNAGTHTQVLMGRFHDGARACAELRELAQTHQQLDILCWAHATTVWLARLSGEVANPMHHARSAVELAEKVGNAFARVVASWALGMAHALAAQWAEAVAVLEDGLTLARGRRASLWAEVLMLAVLAESYAGAGNHRLARARAEEALALARRRETRTQEIEAQLALARVLLRAEGAAARHDVEAALERALGLVMGTGARAFEPYLHVERAALARATGDEAARQHELREAHRLFIEMGAPIRAEQVATQLGP
jgi:class 3 adenylate cyclase/tetratricopeptide (TPR) repeat protein